MAITVNGTAYDNSDIEIRIGLLGTPGKLYPMVKSLNYKGKLEPGKARGTGAVVRQRSKGVYDADGDCEIYEGHPTDPDEAGAIQLRADLGDGYLGKTIVITVTRGGGTNGLPVTVDTIPYGCLTGDDASSQEGGEPAASKFGIFIQKPILRNGVPQVV
jgi:hypothetical protein